jgi:fluoroquinolone transport system permease protein
MRHLLKNDILLQWRQGFWLVYFIVSIIYVIILLNIPTDNRMMVALVMILSDTTMLGVIFIGALILLEKQQKIITSLFVTPLSPGHYIWAKTLSLSFIAITMSILIYLPVWQVSGYTVLILITTAVTAIVFAMLGLGIAASTQTINQYFGRLIGISGLILVPVIPYLLLGQHPAFIWLPYIASLDIMLGAMDPISIWRIMVDMIFILAWGLVAFMFCRSQVKKHLVFA